MIEACGQRGRHLCKHSTADAAEAVEEVTVDVVPAIVSAWITRALRRRAGGACSSMFGSC